MAPSPGFALETLVSSRLSFPLSEPLDVRWPPPQQGLSRSTGSLTIVRGAS